MDCPSCSDHHLKPVRALGVYLDQCESCEGIWFDEGEMTAFRSAQARSAGGQAPALGFKELSEPCAACPQCRADTLVSGEVGGLSVLRCTKCRGVFLPKQEIPEEHDPALDAFARVKSVWYSKGLFRHLVRVLDTKR